ncbi:hypothetical protein RX327_17555 [Bradyrhizobium sp. BEA-2-5]|nr:MULTISPECIES: hypothetical protein [Bradyrhizobium]WOH84808.1 hypothetical protein RX327_17555 [Bradyrhizobium sp. BEA-2-5]
MAGLVTCLWFDQRQARAAADFTPRPFLVAVSAAHVFADLRHELQNKVG